MIDDVCGGCEILAFGSCMASVVVALRDSEHIMGTVMQPYSGVSLPAANVMMASRGEKLGGRQERSPFHYPARTGGWTRMEATDGDK